MPQAARYFFNKDLAEVTPAEAATLIGMIQAPTLYDPRRHPDTCLKRRDVVLGVMKQAGVIDDATYTAALATPIQITKPPGLRRAPYFTDYVTAFVDEDSRLRRPSRRPQGLHDARYRTAGRRRRCGDGQYCAARKEPSTPAPHCAPTASCRRSLVALDAETGAIRAMIGGRDYSQSQFNRAAQRRAPARVGLQADRLPGRARSRSRALLAAAHARVHAARRADDVQRMDARELRAHL